MNTTRLLVFCVLVLFGATPAIAQDNVLQVSAGGSDITTLDPHRATQTTDVVLVGWIYSGLVRFPPGSADPKKLEPDLAESWETSELDVPSAQGRQVPWELGRVGL
jgi:peptide/nickel transport system substrate-binding protein